MRAAVQLSLTGSGARRAAVGLLASSAVALGLLAVRLLVAAGYGFLAWNLFLAWIPLFLAFAVVRVQRSGPRIWLWPLLVLWLVFFPNAPYVVTDFVHLRDIGGMPRWFDAVMLGSFAATSLALGFVSLYLVQDLIRAELGRIWSWLAALTVIGLSGVGIYLGRVAKLNSWDVVNPGRLGSALSAASQHGHRVVLTVVLTCALGAAYAVGQHFAARRARASVRPPRRRGGQGRFPEGR
jgi:uncharacterized membrane protein